MSWPPLKSMDVDILDDFSILMRSCKNAMETLGALSEVNHPKNLQEIVSKLPYQLQERWRQIVFGILQENRRADFGDLVQFVEQQVQIASDPVFGVKEITEAKPFHGKPSKSLCFSSVTKSGLKCYACDQCHTIESCPLMLQLDMPARIETIKKKRLCFACLRPNHISKYCKRRMICSKCNKRRPTMLHVEFKDNSSPAKDQRNEEKTYQENNSKICGETKIMDSSAVLPVLPVQISASGETPVKTYAFLDNGSQSTFITEDLRYKLGQPGNLTTLKITTVEHTSNPFRSRIVTRLHVSDLYGKNTLPLPPVYTIANIPIGDEDIPKKSLKTTWPYLDMDIPEVKAEKNRNSNRM